MCALIFCIFFEAVNEERVIKVVIIFTMWVVGRQRESLQPPLAFDFLVKAMLILVLPEAHYNKIKPCLYCSRSHGSD
jgi:hypothetical protein